VAPLILIRRALLSSVSDSLFFLMATDFETGFFIRVALGLKGTFPSSMCEILSRISLYPGTCTRTLSPSHGDSPTDSPSSFFLFSQKSPLSPALVFRLQEPFVDPLVFSASASPCLSPSPQTFCRFFSFCEDLVIPCFLLHCATRILLHTCRFCLPAG